MSSAGLDYADPPVTEVVAAVAFERLPDAAVALLGSFWWDELREDFPVLESQPPYVAPVEAFTSASRSTLMGLPVPVGNASNRLWATSQSRELLLQLQSDWFACNWRRTPDWPYRHWPTRRQWFEERYAQLQAYLTGRGFGPLSPTQCEVTYVNHIDLDSADEGWASIWEWVALGPESSPDSMAWEQAALELKFLFPTRQDPMGRLHARIAPAIDTRDESRVLLMELTARGAPLTADLNGVLRFLDEGRTAVDQAFEYLTSTEARRKWGRPDVN